MCETHEKWCVNSRFSPLAFARVTKGLVLEFCVLKNSIKSEEAHQANLIMHNKPVGVPQSCGLIPHDLDN